MGHEQHKPLHLRFLQQREDISLFGVASNVVPGPCGSIGNTPFVSRRHVMCRILRIRGGDSQAAQPPLPPPPPPPPPSTGLTVVYENEIYSPDDQSWSAAASSSSFARWTNPDGTSSPPPTAIAAPAGYDFADEWKIDVTGVGVSRDDLGWEYSWDRNGVGRRRRRWLRKLKVRRVQVRDAADVLREQREQERERKYTLEKEEEAKGNEDTKARDVQKASKSETGDTKKEKEKEMDRTKNISRRSSYRFTRGSSRSSAVQRFSRANIWRPIRDNWNFKGYGISMMKSLIFPSAGGISFRLPLSINFDWYERRPELPSITSSATYYYSNICPWTYVVFLNASLPMELIRFCIRRFSEYSFFLGGILWSTMLVLSDALWRVLVFPITVLVRFASLLSDMAINDSSSGPSARGKKRRKKKSKPKTKAKKGTVVILGQAFPRLPPPRGIVYSTVIQDRVGVSASWRLSATRGYEFRISYWHLFLPTMLSMASAVAKAARLMLMMQENASKSKITMKGRVGGDLDDDEDNEQATSTGSIDLWKRFAEPCEDWIQRKTGSFGITWGGPIPEPPFLGASAVLSLSALYPTEVSSVLQSVTRRLSPRSDTVNGRQRRKKDIDGSIQSIEMLEAEGDKVTIPEKSQNQEESFNILAKAPEDDDLDGDKSDTDDAELPISTH